MTARPAIAVLHPYWDLWEHTAGPTFRADRLALARSVAVGLEDAFDPVAVDDVASIEDGRRTWGCASPPGTRASILAHRVDGGPAGLQPRPARRAARYARGRSGLSTRPGCCRVVSITLASRRRAPRWARRCSPTCSRAWVVRSSSSWGGWEIPTSTHGCVMRCGWGRSLAGSGPRDSVASAAPSMATPMSTRPTMTCMMPSGSMSCRSIPTRSSRPGDASTPARIAELETETRTAWDVAADVDEGESLQRSLRAGIGPRGRRRRASASMAAPSTATCPSSASATRSASRRAGASAGSPTWASPSRAPVTSSRRCHAARRSDSAPPRSTRRSRPSTTRAGRSSSPTAVSMTSPGWHRGSGPALGATAGSAARTRDCGVCAAFEPASGPASLVGFTPHPDARGGFRFVVARGELTARRFPETGTVNGAFRFADGSVDVGLGPLGVGGRQPPQLGHARRYQLGRRRRRRSSWVLRP